MKKETTKEKIIRVAIGAFNQEGVSNVTLRKIASEANMSNGNLTYHYKTKKELVLAIYNIMSTEIQAKFPFLDQFEGGRGLQITNDLLTVMLKYRFIYQDTLEVIRICPEIQPLYNELRHRMYRLIENTTYLAIGKGIMQPEPIEGHYQYFAKNVWLTFNFWMVNERIAGNTVVDISEGLRMVANLIYPNYTEKGRAMYDKVFAKLTS